MRLTLTAPASIEAADVDTRVLAGIALPYGQKGYTSAGPVTIDAGAIRVPDNLRAVKLFREHGRQTPIGYATDATDGATELRMSFRVAGTPDGDTALLEAAEGVRDALSVELNNVTMKAGHVTGADLVAVAQVAVPAFAGAQLTATLSDDDQADVNDLAAQIVAKTNPDDEDEEDPDVEPDAGTPSQEDTMARPDVEAGAPASLTMTPPTTRPRSAARDRKLWASAAVEALRGATDASQVNAALADITPVDSDPDSVFPRPAWLGELWTPQAANRPLLDAIGVSPLTSMQIDGWRWDTLPEVDAYAGNKAEVPTNVASIVPASATAQRIAGGWDIDRIYMDFNTGFMEAFQRAAVQDYRKKSQSFLIDGHPAIAGPPAIPAYPSIWSQGATLPAVPNSLYAVESIVSFLVSNGASPDFIFMSGDLFAELLQMTGADAPWWLGAGSLGSLRGNGDLAGTTFSVDPDLPARTVVGGARDAVSLWETGPINVTAVNLPNGGIDFGLFGYYANMVHDVRGLATVSVDGPAVAAKKAAK